MKTIEKEYVESYDRQGCMAFVFGALVLFLLLSMIANGIMYMKIKKHEKAPIKTTSVAYSQTTGKAGADGEQEEDRVLPYYQVEEREQAVQDGESCLQEVRNKRARGSVGGNRP